MFADAVELYGSNMDSNELALGVLP